MKLLFSLEGEVTSPLKFWASMDPKTRLSDKMNFYCILRCLTELPVSKIVNCKPLINSAGDFHWSRDRCHFVLLPAKNLSFVIITEYPLIFHHMKKILSPVVAILFVIEVHSKFSLPNLEITEPNQFLVKSILWESSKILPIFTNKSWQTYFIMFILANTCFTP